MKENPLISIIVPIYNTEKYLHRCIDSIISQTFTDWECLLIDDGSTDNSPAICDEYAQKDSRIKVFHKENGGVSSARNVGLKHAKGEWITFVDADDFVLSDFLYIIYDTILVHNFDLLRWGNYDVEKGVVKQTITPSGKFYVENISFIMSSDYRHMVWSYLFRKIWIDKYNIRFIENLRYSEDQNFLLKYISHVSMIQTISIVPYNYVARQGSAVTSYRRIDSLVCNLQAALEYAEYSTNYADISVCFSVRAITMLINDFVNYLYALNQIDYSKAQLEYSFYYGKLIKIFPQLKRTRRFMLLSKSIRMVFFFWKLKDLRTEIWRRY